MITVRSEDRSPVSFRGALVIAAVLPVCQAVAIGIFTGNTTYRVTVSTGLLLIADLLVTAALLWAARRSASYGRKVQLGWAVMALARVVLTISDASWLTADLHSQPALDSSSVNLSLILYYVVFVAGIVLLAGTAVSRWDRMRLGLDTGITLVAAGVSAWAFVAAAVKSSHWTGSVAGGMDLPGPFAVLLMLAVLSWVLVRPVERNVRRSLWLLAGALGIELCVDLLFVNQYESGGYVPSNWFDVGWMVSYLMVGLAAVWQASHAPAAKDNRRVEAESPLTVPLQYAWTAVLYVLLIRYYSHPLAIPFYALAGVVGGIIALTFLRHLVTLRENAVLYRAAQGEIAERRKAEEALRLRAAEQEQMLQSARQVTASLELNQVLTYIAAGARSIIGCVDCAIYLLDSGREVLKPLISVDPLYEAQTLATELDVRASLTGQAVMAGRVMVFNDAGHHPLGAQIPGTPEEANERVMAAPFIVRGEIVGAMSLSRLDGDFTAEDEAMAETFAFHAAASLMNARAHAALQREVEERTAAEEALLALNEELESRVHERTAELEEANEALSAEIVERRRAEEHARASLHEREVLLREIHHRVKNNLQVISSLLVLQSGHVADPRTLAILKDGQNRVRSMALIHEKLYGSDNLASIDFGSYIRDLVAFLFRSYRVESSAVSLAVETEEVRLGIDAAIPCGLIINELVSNCLKHGFPGGRPGQVQVMCERNGDNRLILKVGDDGVGFPLDLDFRRTSSLGLQLVNTLVSQIGGDIDLEREPRTTFSISFPAEEAKSVT